MRHYIYQEIVRYATGQVGERRIFFRHIDNCRPCFRKWENAKKKGENSTSLFLLVMAFLSTA